MVQPASGQFSRVFAKSKTWFKPKKLIFLSGMVEFSRPFDLAQGRLQTKRGFVMPAEAGIHLGFAVGLASNLAFGKISGSTETGDFLIDRGCSTCEFPTLATPEFCQE